MKNTSHYIENEKPLFFNDNTFVKDYANVFSDEEDFLSLLSRVY